MINNIMADIKRILHKNSFLNAIAIFIGIFAALVFIYYNPYFTAEIYAAKITSYLSFLPLVIGLFVFISVYVDDFKCKSMQVAIGYGISRKKIILLKLIESTILLLGVGMIVGLFVILTPTVLGMDLGNTQSLNLILTVFAEVLRSVGYVALSSVPMFYSQNAVNGIICYVLLSTKTVFIILNMILGQDIILQTFGDLTKHLYTVQLYTAKTLCIQNESFGLLMIVSILIYVIVPTVISMIGFEKKELEF